MIPLIMGVRNRTIKLRHLTNSLVMLMMIVVALTKWNTVLLKRIKEIERIRKTKSSIDVVNVKVNANVVIANVKTRLRLLMVFQSLLNNWASTRIYSTHSAENGNMINVWNVLQKHSWMQKEYANRLIPTVNFLIRRKDVPDATEVLFWTMVSASLKMIKIHMMILTVPNGRMDNA